MHQPGLFRSRSLASRPSIRPQRRPRILPKLRLLASSRSATTWPPFPYAPAPPRRASSAAPASSLSPGLVNQFRFGNHAGVIRPYYLFFPLLVVATSSVPPKVGAQSTEPQIATQTSAPKAKITYPDTQSGLKQLASDILQAQKENNGSRAQELLDSLLPPNFNEWYAQNFSEAAVARVIPAYTANAPRLPAQLAGVFLSTYQEGFRTIDAVRYDDEKSACSSAQVFSAMTARKTPVPLYELRFTHGDQFKRVFAFAYVDGTFRIVPTPDFSKPSGRVIEKVDDAGSKVSNPDQRVPAGATVQAARLVCKVQPYYPEEARLQRISGTVRFHTIIGADGSIKQLEALTGPPILVDAAKRAVSRWRYRPTLLNGEPVEIDTTIDVIFSLSP